MTGSIIRIISGCFRFRALVEQDEFIAEAACCHCRIRVCAVRLVWSLHLQRFAEGQKTLRRITRWHQQSGMRKPVSDFSAMCLNELLRLTNAYHLTMFT